MEASPSRCKRGPAAVAETTVDSLPPEVLENIVSLLPLQDAVATSAVSRSWRRLWESAPNLDLAWSLDADPADAEAVLTRYSRPVRSFCFQLTEGSFWRADSWVPLLARKGVQILLLHFRVNRGDPYGMNPSIFSCRELTRLNLKGCNIPAVPTGFTGFPNLTWLSLWDVGFRETGVRGLEELIAASPLLEALWLNDLWFPHGDDDDEHEHEEWIIQAPNLQKLSITSTYDFGWQVNELPSIEEVDISCESYTITRDFVRLLTGLTRVENLKLKMPLIEDNALEGLSCSFYNLTDLTLRTDFCTLPTMLSTLCLLKSAPNLEELTFEISCDNLQEEEIDIGFLNAQLSDGPFDNLKSVSMDAATGQSNEMHFIEFVLSKARRLQEFHICVYAFCPRSNEDLVVAIAKYKRASPQAKVYFRRMELNLPFFD